MFKRTLKIILIFLPYVFLVLLLYLAKSYSYLFFHVTVELFSILVALAVYMLMWNARVFLKNYYFLFMGIGFAFVGAIGFFHMLAYKGMPVFIGFDANLPTQLWIAQRYLLTLILLIAPIFFKRKFNATFVFAVFFSITLFILSSIFYWKIFPTSYVEGVGLTQFKIVSEIIIIFLFILAAVNLTRFKKGLDRITYTLLIFSIILNVISELCFALYVGVFDFFNMTGHIVMLFSYYLVYRAIIQIGLTQPYNLLFLELEQSGRRKDEFLGIASHELKNPVTSIKLYTQLLINQLKKSKDPNNLFLSKRIDDQIDKITNLINDLLNVSKIEAGKLTYNFNTVNYSALIKQIVSEQQRLSPKNKIVLKTPEKITLNVDKDRIAQVLINLINNAVKYSPVNKKVEIYIIKNADNVTTKVRDFGIGIPKSQQLLIFEKYYRTGRDEKTTPGMGLGLYIAREIIKHHQGKIGVESTKGKGSTFYFTLPLKH